MSACGRPPQYGGDHLVRGTLMTARAGSNDYRPDESDARADAGGDHRCRPGGPAAGAPAASSRRRRGDPRGAEPGVHRGADPRRGARAGHHRGAARGRSGGADGPRGPGPRRDLPALRRRQPSHPDERADRRPLGDDLRADRGGQGPRSRRGWRQTLRCSSSVATCPSHGLEVGEPVVRYVHEGSAHELHCRLHRRLRRLSRGVPNQHPRRAFSASGSANIRSAGWGSSPMWRRRPTS